MENNKQQQLVERVTLAISEHHSGNADEARLIAQAAISILQPELQKREWQSMDTLPETLYNYVDLWVITPSSPQGYRKCACGFCDGKWWCDTEQRDLHEYETPIYWRKITRPKVAALTATDTVQGGHNHD